MRALRTLGADTRGAAIIEMAFVAPILATILVCMVDLSGAYSKKLQLEQAAQRTIERAQQTLVNSTFLATLRVEAANAANVPVAQVTLDYWLECNGTRSTTFDIPCSSGQSAARFVSIDVWDTYTPMFARQFTGSTVNGSYTLHGKSGLRVQ